MDLVFDQHHFTIHSISDPEHPLLDTQLSRGRISSEKSRRRPGPAGDMGLMSPGRLHQQVSGVVPSIDVSDEDNR